MKIDHSMMDSSDECHVCGSDEHITGDEIEIDAWEARQDQHCMMCGSGWVGVYELVHRIQVDRGPRVYEVTFKTAITQAHTLHDAYNNIRKHLRQHELSQVSIDEIRLRDTREG